MQLYATPVPTRTLARGRLAAQLPASSYANAVSVLHLAPSLHFSAPYLARWSLIHAHTKFDASCCHSTCPRNLSWLAYNFGAGRDRCALRHFDGGYSADYGPAG